MRTSTSVSAHPATKGIFNSRLSAMADPMTLKVLGIVYRIEGLETYFGDVRGNDGSLAHYIEYNV